MRYSDKIGQQIRSIRESRGYSQEYMAEMLGTCQSAYANLESGKSIMRVDRLLEICSLLEMDVHQLLEQCGTKKLAGQMNARDGERNTRDGERNTEMNLSEKQVYEQMILSLRSEIDFLRSLLKSPDKLC
jgi:transcriptional regulator with XRE-family HTH domain